VKTGKEQMFGEKNWGGANGFLLFVVELKKYRKNEKTKRNRNSKRLVNGYAVYNYQTLKFIACLPSILAYGSLSVIAGC
jgi:hypothetical protein